MKYDYLIVGSGLYGAIFAHEAKTHGKTVLVVDKRPNIAGNIYTENIESINVHKYGAHIFNKIIKRYGTILRSLQSLIVSPIRPLLITKVNSTHCLSICIHSIKCGVS